MIILILVLTKSESISQTRFDSSLISNAKLIKAISIIEKGKIIKVENDLLKEKILLQENLIFLKDSSIAGYKAVESFYKEGVRNYKETINLLNIKYGSLENQFNIATTQLKKQKTVNIINKIGYLAIGFFSYKYLIQK